MIGNREIEEHLKRIVERGTFGNSYLFSGPEGVGKSLFALEFARALLCRQDPRGVNAHKLKSGNHPDLCLYRPEGKIGFHSIESMRRFNEEVFKSPYEAPYKVFILSDAHRMLPYSANALLKTFEEPLETSIIILLSHAPHALLPTILSRCQTLHFQRIPEHEIAAFLMEERACPSDKAAAIARLSDGSLQKALSFLEEKNEVREKVLTLLEKGRFSSYFDLLQAVKELVEMVEKRKTLIEKQARQTLLKGLTLKELPAAQQHLLEKEIEGAVSAKVSEQIEEILISILYWYRDLHLIYDGGELRFLFHSDRYEALKAQAFKGEPLALEEVTGVILEAKQSHARSTSLPISFEHLFLKLDK